MPSQVDILIAAKTAVRVSGADYDDEVQSLIDSALADLGLSGVSQAISADDTLIRNAVLTYVKANFGFDNPDAERLDTAYESFKNRLRLSSVYTEQENG